MFESLWTRASSILDRAVDGVVGDRMRYWHRGQWIGAHASGTATMAAGFVVLETERPSLDAIDETLGSKKRVKVAKALVEEVLPTDRIAHPQLGSGWFRPAGALPDEDDRYWLFDVQAASAPLGL